MPIQLFPHNMQAYEAAKTMLNRTSKAAIIHPTGTGKSFIAFKLCEENPSARVCWLSPSEYIYRTQLENVKQTSGFEPLNIMFFTYAKLMMLTQRERRDIRPDYIILDEFHRCGAAEWGKGVQALLEDYPHARLLGLTATHIRYLDEQRDMADELFDGYVAHQMTLGEAIVRGILPAPKYVMALYSVQKELERYACRARKAGGAVQRQAEQILERLRHKLEAAEGLDKLFQKHMENQSGKYILFCSDREQMRKLTALVPQWFSGVDDHPHIYEVFAESTEARQAFRRFKEDESDHLKILMCIDMLNEGVHIGGLSGVILCRPTISPIVYKQQIGRALSALKDGTPVIFDLVNNVENLYTISSVRQEMEEVVTYYCNVHREDEIAQNGFEVVDEVRACRELFEQLEAALSASWEMMYAEAAAYYRENGHLNVPKRYRTQANLALGSWLQTQRAVRRGTRAGRLTAEQIAKLDAIGMVWQCPAESRWESGYAHARAYREEYGHLDVPARYVCEDGYRLGKWIANMRSARNEKGRSALAADRIAKLDGLGMIWNRVDFNLERSLHAAAQYAATHGDLRVPVAYVDENGFKLGKWLAEARGNQSRLSAEKKRRLTELGMDWHTHPSTQWESCYQAAADYHKVHGCLSVPAKLEWDGVPLGRWLYRQRELYMKGKLSPSRVEKLEALGIDWQPPTPWEKSFAEAGAYYAAHGSLRACAQYVTPNGLWLERWVSAQRKAYREGKLTDEQKQKLESIGICWETKPDTQWMGCYKALQAALCGEEKPRAGDTASTNVLRLRRWYERQCKRASDGVLEPWQVEKLRTLSFAAPSGIHGKTGAEG